MVTDKQKIRLAQQALVSYNNQMIEEFGGDAYTLTPSSLERVIIAQSEDFLLEFGGALAQSDLGIRRTAEAMERVVEKSTPNDIPRTFTFIQGIVDELSDFDFSLFSDTAIDIAKDFQEKGREVTESIGEAVTGVVDSVGFLGRNLKFIIMGIVAIGAFILFNRTKSLSKE
tara:strand:+ start:8540 stop:9052 length:513 start_codon:yes stop_codon:yes gene_type:complete